MTKTYYDNNGPTDVRPVLSPISGIQGAIIIPPRGIVRHQSQNAVKWREANNFRYRRGAWVSAPLASLVGPRRTWRLEPLRAWEKGQGTEVQRLRRWHRASRAHALDNQRLSLVSWCALDVERRPVMDIGAEFRARILMQTGPAGWNGHDGIGFVSRSTLTLAGIKGERIDVVVDKPVGSVRYVLDTTQPVKHQTKASWRRAQRVARRINRTT